MTCVPTNEDRLANGENERERRVAKDPESIGQRRDDGLSRVAVVERAVEPAPRRIGTSTQEPEPP